MQNKKKDAKLVLEINLMYTDKINWLKAIPI
jgi:hypothetical protein